MEDLEKGLWTTAKDVYPNPETAILENLYSIRAIVVESDMYHLVPPADHIKGDPLPLEMEIKGLIIGGMVGADPKQCFVTVQELIAIAPRIWNLDTQQSDSLRNTIIPEALEWDKKIREEAQLQQEKADVNTNIFFLRSWNVERFDTFVSLLKQSRSIRLPHVTDMIARYERIHKNLLPSVQQELDKIVTSSGDRAGLPQLITLSSKVKSIIAEFTFLLESDIDDITRQEEKYGYMYLDSLIQGFPAMFNTFPIAKQIQLSTGTGRWVETPLGALDARALALGNLVYHAPDNIAKRGVFQRMFSQKKKSLHLDAGSILK